MPTAGEWAEALQLKKVGAREWQGPCPVCGGTDRFHCREGEGRAVVGCRGCIDGRADSGKQFGQVLKAAFPGRFGTLQGTATYTPPAKPKGKQGEWDSTAAACQLWAAGVDAEGTPAAQYLRSRKLWPEHLPIDLPDVLFVPQWDKAAPKKDKPLDCAGFVLWAFRDPFDRSAQLQAVQFEALREDGQRTSPRLRRVWGVASATCWRPRPLAPAQGVLLVEGPTSALACWWLAPQWVGSAIDVQGVVSASSMASVVAPVERGPLWIVSDPDEPGRDAARAARDACGPSVTCDVLWTGNDGGDAVDWLAAELDTQSGKGIDGGHEQKEADARAWEGLAAARISPQTKEVLE